MDVFVPVMNQIAFLFGFIAIGYILVELDFVPENASVTLAKLENTIFVPGLILGTFITNFTIERISSAWKLMLISGIIGLIAIAFAIVTSKLITRDGYIRNIYTYGLSFANFGFMGNAVVKGIYPDIFFEYIVFTLPLWIFIYIWGVPALLISDTEHERTFKDTLKSFINPMFISVILGTIIGLSNVKLPAFVLSIVTVSGDCMSPVAMILTGMVVASISLKTAFTNIRTYIVSFIRLIIMPLILIAVAKIIKIPETVYLCGLCSLAMPLGLNTIVIPGAYGKDTSEAAGMTLVSHLLACLTIPIIMSCA